MDKTLRLGINIDHVATLRNARGGTNPCPIRAAQLAKDAGADGITAHLREDRRHIRDHDIERLKNEVALPLNLEMAMTDEMLAIALKTQPHAVCIVPEKREELTTEGGLDAVRLEKKLTPFVKKLQDNGSRVSLFIAPSHDQIYAAARIGARVIELHTGTYCDAIGHARETHRAALSEAAMLAHGQGLEVHAGHGLDYENVGPIAAIPELVELNIGHFLIGEAVFVGLKEAIARMREAMKQGATMILGTGNDITDIRRIEKSLARFGARFENRVFTKREQAKAHSRDKAGIKVVAGTYAKRFAAKEACAKALGTGLRAGTFWRDMEVVNLPSGAPTLRLTGGALEHLTDMTPKGMKAVIHLSLSDEYPYAQAHVMIEAVHD